MIIRLSDILFHSFIGVHEFEKLNGNDFKVTVEILLSESKAIETDDIKETLDYTLVYQTIAEIMAEKASLLEHVAWKIGNALKSLHTSILTVTVSLHKIHPPIGGHCESASVQLTIS